MLMDSLFRKHDRLLANTSMKIVRDKMDEIHWNTRLVSILGAKGVGKSTLIRQYLKQHFKLIPTTYGKKCPPSVSLLLSSRII